jgi:hypothetical protein
MRRSQLRPGSQPSGWQGLVGNEDLDRPQWPIDQGIASDPAPGAARPQAHSALVTIATMPPTPRQQQPLPAKTPARTQSMTLSAARSGSHQLDADREALRSRVGPRSEHYGRNWRSTRGTTMSVAFAAATRRAGRYRVAVVPYGRLGAVTRCPHWADGGCTTSRTNGSATARVSPVPYAESPNTSKQPGRRSSSNRDRPTTASWLISRRRLRSTRPR